MIGDVVLLGFGSSVNFLPTLGFSIGAAVVRHYPQILDSTLSLPQATYDVGLCLSQSVVDVGLSSGEGG